MPNVHKKYTNNFSLSCGTYSDMLIRIVHHGNQHIKKNHQWDDVISTKHGGTHKFSELVIGLHIGHIQADQPENRPEQRLQGLK